LNEYQNVTDPEHWPVVLFYGRSTLFHLTPFKFHGL
jgi:hypothetical protein